MIDRTQIKTMANELTLLLQTEEEMWEKRRKVRICTTYDEAKKAATDILGTLDRLEKTCKEATQNNAFRDYWQLHLNKWRYQLYGILLYRALETGQHKSKCKTLAKKREGCMDAIKKGMDGE